jgi:Beta-lactamase class C and other penicillin binding proteins
MDYQEVLQKLYAPNPHYEGLDLALRMQYYHIASFSLAWHYKGQVFTHVEGKRRLDGSLVQPDSLFQAGSISKPAFTALVMRLHQEGKLDIHHDVNDYLQGYRVQAPEGEKITIAMLLSHMAGFNVHGFPGYDPSATVTNDDVIMGLGNTPKPEIDFPPNTCWRYSGGGYQIAQKAVEDIMGQDTSSLADQYVFAPLMMQDSGYWQPLCEARQAQAAYAMRGGEEGYHFYPETASAGLWTTPSDLLKLALAFGRSYKGNGYLNQEVAQMMMQPVWTDRCIGIFHNGTTGEFYHGGSNYGFESLMLYHPDHDFALAIMANNNGASALNRQIANVIIDTLHAYEG